MDMFKTTLQTIQSINAHDIRTRTAAQASVTATIGESFSDSEESSETQSDTRSESQSDQRSESESDQHTESSSEQNTCLRQLMILQIPNNKQGV